LGNLEPLLKVTGFSILDQNWRSLRNFGGGGEELLRCLKLAMNGILEEVIVIPLEEKLNGLAQQREAFF
jgi:hypothetical protein